MDYCKGKVAKSLVDHFGDDVRRITHALEVLKYSEKIMEAREGWGYEVLIASALLHDIGIKRSEEILGCSNGHTQEQYGPPIARELLESIGFAADKVTRICEIIGNHHSPLCYDYVELKILKEADGMVNKLEGDSL